MNGTLVARPARFDVAHACVVGSLADHRVRSVRGDYRIVGKPPTRRGIVPWWRRLVVDGGALARGFAEGMMLADARSPTWGDYQPGLGPHPENQTVKLIMAELALIHPTTFGAFKTGVSYPNAPRQRCDLLVSPSEGRSWVVGN